MLLGPLEVKIQVIRKVGFFVLKRSVFDTFSTKRLGKIRDQRTKKTSKNCIKGDKWLKATYFGSFWTILCQVTILCQYQEAYCSDDLNFDIKRLEQHFMKSCIKVVCNLNKFIYLIYLDPPRTTLSQTRINLIFPILILNQKN